MAYFYTLFFTFWKKSAKRFGSQNNYNSYRLYLLKSHFVPFPSHTYKMLTNTYKFSDFAFDAYKQLQKPVDYIFFFLIEKIR